MAANQLQDYDSDHLERQEKQAQHMDDHGAKPLAPHEQASLDQMEAGLKNGDEASEPGGEKDKQAPQTLGDRTQAAFDKALEDDGLDSQGFWRGDRVKTKGIKGIVKNRKIMVILATGGVSILSLSAFLGFMNVFKLEHFLQNINVNTFSRVNASFDRRSDAWFRAYLRMRLAEIEGSNEPGDSMLFRANRVDTDNPARDWYKTLRSSRFERDLFEKQGIRFTSIAVQDGDTIRLRPALITINDEIKARISIGDFEGQTISAADIRAGRLDASLTNYLNTNFDEEARRQYITIFEDDKTARRRLRQAQKDNGHFWDVIMHRQARKGSANMTGIRDWRFFDERRTAVEDKAAEFNQKLLVALTPDGSRSQALMLCLFALGPCPASSDPNHKDNRTLDADGGRLSGTARDPDDPVADPDNPGGVDAEGNPITVPNTGTEAADLVDGALDTGAGNDLAPLTPMEKIAKRLTQDIIGGASGPRLVIKVLDKLSAINSAFKEDSNGESKVDKLTYVARAAIAMTVFTRLMTMNDQIKSGEIGDAAQVNEAMKYLNNAEKSEAYQMATGVDTSSFPEDCTTTAQYEAEDQVPLCDAQKPNGGNRTSGLQDGWNRFVSDGVLGTILDAYYSVRNNPLFRFADRLLGSLTDAVLGPIFEATGITDAATAVTGWLTVKLSSWVGILPCVDGTEKTGAIAMNCAVVGAQASAEVLGRMAGGVRSLVGSEEYNYANDLAANYQKDTIQSQSLSERYLALDNSNSLAAKTLFSVSTSSPGKFLSSLSPSKLLSSVFGTFTGRARAQTGDLPEQLGVNRYDTHPHCDSRELDPIELVMGADAEQTYLDNSTNAPASIPRTWEMLSDMEKFTDAVYEAVGGDQAAAEAVYNCVLRDIIVMGGMGYTSGWRNDGGLENGTTGPSTVGGPSMQGEVPLGGYLVPNIQRDTDADSCTGGLQPGTQELGDYVAERWDTNAGGYACRSKSTGPELSIHAEGRAVDADFNAFDPAQLQRGNEVFGWLLANAESIGIQYVKFWKLQWSPVRGLRCVTDAGDIANHSTHIHYEVNRSAARQGTPWFTTPTDYAPLIINQGLCQ